MDLRLTPIPLDSDTAAAHTLFFLILTDLASFRRAVSRKSLISSIFRGMATRARLWRPHSDENRTSLGLLNAVIIGVLSYPA